MLPKTRAMLIITCASVIAICISVLLSTINTRAAQVSTLHTIIVFFLYMIFSISSSGLFFVPIGESNRIITLDKTNNPRQMNLLTAINFIIERAAEIDITVRI